MCHVADGERRVLGVWEACVVCNIATEDDGGLDHRDQSGEEAEL